MLIRFAEVYENTEVLSPIDLETWRVIGEISKLGPGSNVIELGSGKGAFAMYLAQTYGCRVNGFDGNLEFVDYAYRRAREQGLENVNFYKTDVNRLEVSPNAYDLGACLGALYIFRDAGWKLLMRTVKPNGYLAISDLYCKKVPAPRESHGRILRGGGSTPNHGRPGYGTRAAGSIFSEKKSAARRPGWITRIRPIRRFPVSQENVSPTRRGWRRSTRRSGKTDSSENLARNT